MGIFSVIEGAVSIMNAGVIAAVKAASTAVVAADPALVVAVSPNAPVYTREIESPTFFVFKDDVAPGNGTSMLSIVNTDATMKLRVHEIYIVNQQTSAVTGVYTSFGLFRIGGHSSGTDVTSSVVESADTADTKNSNWTVRTGATVSSESANMFHHIHWSADDLGTGTLDQEGLEHAIQSAFPAWRKGPCGVKPMVLRQNEGITVKCNTSTTVGTFSIAAVVTQET